MFFTLYLLNLHPLCGGDLIFFIDVYCYYSYSSTIWQCKRCTVTNIHRIFTFFSEQWWITLVQYENWLFCISKMAGMEDGDFHNCHANISSSIVITTISPHLYSYSVCCIYLSVICVDRTCTLPFVYIVAVMRKVACQQLVHVWTFWNCLAFMTDKFSVINCYMLLNQMLGLSSAEVENKRQHFQHSSCEFFKCRVLCTEYLKRWQFLYLFLGKCTWFLESFFIFCYKKINW